MKLSINTDFTRLPRAASLLRAREADAAPPPFDIIVLTHDERHLRRKVLKLQHGDSVLVDLPEPVALEHGDRLVLEDGRSIEVIAAEEELYAVTARDALHLTELAWHLGNRHLPAQIEERRIVILRDHVIKGMLEGLGATVADILEPFQPVRGAYHGHAHEQGERDRFGRLPGDPHYGHNHA